MIDIEFFEVTIFTLAVLAATIGVMVATLLERGWIFAALIGVVAFPLTILSIAAIGELIS